MYWMVGNYWWGDFKPKGKNNESYKFVKCFRLVKKNWVANGGNLLEITTNANTAIIDFHSNSSFITNYDARILASGGTALPGGATLELIGNTVNINTLKHFRI